MPHTPVLAYVDPGSGHLILQVIAGFFLGSLFYAKQAWAWIRGKRSAAKKTKTPPRKKASGE